MLYPALVHYLKFVLNYFVMSPIIAQSPASLGHVRRGRSHGPRTPPTEMVTLPFLISSCINATVCELTLLRRSLCERARR